MVTNFPDILSEGETVLKFVEVAATGKGTTDRDRRYVRPIALRYVERHGQHQLEIQTARRQLLTNAP